MEAWKRIAKVAVHTILITIYVGRGLLYTALPPSVASAVNGSPLRQHYLQDWQTLYLDGDPYTVRLYLDTDMTIDVPLGSGNLPHVAGIIALNADSLRVSDPDLERRLVLLAQNRAIWENGTPWWNDMVNTDGLGSSFPLHLHGCNAMVISGLNPFYRLSIEYKMQTNYLQRREYYEDIVNYMVYPSLQPEFADGVVAAFERDFSDLFEEAAESVTGVTVSDVSDAATWTKLALHEFSLLVADQAEYSEIPEATQALADYSDALSLSLSGISIGAKMGRVHADYTHAYEFARSMAIIAASQSFYAHQRATALRNFVHNPTISGPDNLIDPALVAAVDEVYDDTINADPVYIQSQWELLWTTFWDKPEKNAGFLLSLGLFIGKLAGVVSLGHFAIPVTIAIKGAVWLYERDNQVIAGSLALTLETAIRQELEARASSVPSDVIVLEEALFLSNMRYIAGWYLYETLVQRVDWFPECLFYWDCSDDDHSGFIEAQDDYYEGFIKTLPPVFHAYAAADDIIDRIGPAPKEEFASPSVTPEYGYETTVFDFRVIHLSQNPSPPDAVSLIIDGASYPTTLEGCDLWGLNFCEYQATAGPFSPGRYLFHFEALGVPPSGESWFQVIEPTDTQIYVGLTSPAPEAIVSGHEIVRAEAISEVGIDHVAFHIGTIVACQDYEAPYECPWNTRLTNNGRVDLMVVAHDTQDRWDSAAQQVVVHNPAHNEPPSIEVLAPDSDTAYGRFTIKWQDEDLDDTAKISLYYDTNSSGLNGVLIQDHISEDWTSDSWSWDISSLPSGNSYWIFAKIDDGTNPPVYDYSPGPLTIQSPTVADNFEVDHVVLQEETGGDGDGVPDAGEELDFRVYIRNKSGQKHCYTRGELSTSTPGVEITGTSVNYQSPTPGQVTRGTGDFDFQTISSFDGTIDFTLQLVYENCSTGAKSIDTEFLSVEIHPDDTTAPVITSGPTVSQITPASAIVSWTTDEPSDSVVEYGLTTAYGSQTSVSGYTTTHEVHLVGLYGGMTYYFRVNSTDPSSNGPTQAAGLFTTTNIGDGLHVDDIIYPTFDEIKGLAWDGTHLWVLQREPSEFFRVYEYDMGTQSVVSSFNVDFIPEPDTGACGLAWDGSYLWMANTSARELYRIDTSGSVHATISVPMDDPCGLAWGDGNLWVSDLEELTIYRMTTGGTIVDSFPSPSLRPRELAWGQGHLWVADDNAGQLFKITPSGDFVDLYPAYGTARGLTFIGTDHLLEALDTSPLDRLLYIQTVEDTVSPIIGVPTVLGTSSGAAYLEWASDEPTYGYVNYGTTTSYGYTVTLSTPSMTHTTPVVGLDPNQTYHFRVGGRDLPGNDRTWSGDYTFTTSAETAYNIRSFFRVPAYGGWRIDGIAWDGTQLRAVEGSMDDFFTLSPEDGTPLELVYWQYDDTDPEDITWENGYLWVANNESPDYLYRVNPTTGANVRALEWTYGHPRGITWDGTNLWVSTSSTIYRVNPNTGVADFNFSAPMGTSAGTLAWDGTHIWMVDRNTDGSVYRLATNGTVVDSFKPPFSSLRGIAWDGNYLWVTDNLEDTFYRFDPATTVAPVVESVVSEDIDHGADYEFYPVGSRILITAYEQYGRIGLTATLTVTSSIDDPGIRDQQMLDNGDGSYSFLWYSAGQATADDYGVEVRLTDGVHTDTDGLARQPDLRITLAHDYAISQTITISDVEWWGANGLVWTGDDVWVTRGVPGSVNRLDQDTGEVAFSFLSPEEPGGRAAPRSMDWDGSYIWLANSYYRWDATVTRHTTGGALVSTVSINDVEFVEGFALDGSYMWAVDEERLQVNRFATSGGSPNLRLDAPCRNPSGLARYGSHLWLTCSPYLFVMETNGNVVDHYFLPITVRDIAFHGDDLWALNSQTRALYWLVTKPDLAVEPLAVSAVSTPQDVLTHITATVHATNVPADDVVLRFYDGDPDSGGTQIGSDYLLGTVTPGTPVVVVLDWSAQPLGLYDIYARVDPADAVDEGNETNNTVSIEIVVYDADPDPPVISDVVVSEHGGDGDGFLEDNEQIRIDWSASDPGSGISATSVTVGGSTYPATGSYYAIVGPLATDFYTFTIQATDNSSETQTYDGEFVVVPHAVQVTNTLPAPGATDVLLSDQIGVHFETSIDPGSLSDGMFQIVSVGGVTVTGRVEYDAVLESVTFIPFNELENDTAYTATILSGLDGPMDEYSNTLESPYVWSFTTVPDTTPPVAVLSGPEPALTYNRSVSVFGSALDKNLDTYVVQYGEGTSPISWTTAADSSWTVADSYLGGWDTTGVPDGVYTIRLVVSDTVGASTVDTMTVQIDNSPPTDPASLYSTSHTVGVWTNQTVVTVTWSAVTDAGSGVAGHAVAWDPWAGGEPEPVVELGPGVLTTASSPLADGDEWTFSLISRDGVGNWSEPVYLGPFYIDTQPPSSAALLLPETTESLTVTVCWDGEDTASGIAAYDVWVRDGSSGTWTQWLSGVTQTCADFVGENDHTYYFESRAWDSAGNAEMLSGGDGDTHTTIQRGFEVFLPLAFGGYSASINRPPNVPTSPSPSDGATSQSVNVDLSWTGGDPDGDSVTYDVYFEANDSSPDALLCNDATSAFCDPGTLGQGAHYYWQVVTRDEHGATTTGPVWDFTTTSPPNNPPNTPSNPSPSDGATNQSVNVNLSWTGGDPDGDSVTYDVYFEAGDTTPGVLLCNDATSAFCDPGTLGYDAHYYWQVVARDEHGATTTGPVWDFTTTSPPNPPSSPSPSDGAANQSVNVDLSWTGGDPDGDSVTYDVYLEAGDSTPDVLVSDDQSGTSYDPGTLSVGTHYYWQIVARDSHGATTTGPVWDFATTQAPNMPSSPSPVDGATNQSLAVDLGWTGGDPDGDSVTYDVYFEAGDSTPDVLVSDDQSSTSYDPGTLSVGTHYYWQVVARDSHGVIATGPVWDFTTTQAPNTPSSPSPADGAINQSVNVNLSWTGGDPDGDSVTYDVYFEADDATPDTLLCNDTTTAFCDPGTLDYDTPYYWQVVTTDEHGATTTGPVWGFASTAEMILIPADPDPFYIDKYEVTNAQYRACVDGGACDPPLPDSSRTRSPYYSDLAYDDYPVVNVSWYSATQYCTWAGKRLPTEAEWEWAAYGTDGRSYPWGNEGPNCTRVNYNNCIGDTSQVGDYLAGQSPYGVMDMAGNVWEWCEDWFQPDVYKVLRGGCFDNPDVSSSARKERMPAYGVDYVGFRCAQSVPNNPPNTPSAPSPADGSIGQPITVTLSWTGGDPDGDSVTYDVYFEANDATPDALLCDDAPGTSCDPGTLSQGTHYYWQVVARDEHGATTTGPVWDFTASGSWEEVGAGSASGGGISDNSGNSSGPSVAIAPDGTPYVAWYDYSGGDMEIYVRRWNGSSWEEVGTGSASGGGISDNSSASREPSVAIAPDGTPCVTWYDYGGGDGEIYVRRWK